MLAVEPAAGGAAGDRTQDRRTIRSTASCAMRVGCADDTNHCTEGTDRDGTIWRAPVHEPVHGRSSQPVCPATVRNIANSARPASARATRRSRSRRFYSPLAPPEPPRADQRKCRLRRDFGPPCPLCVRGCWVPGPCGPRTGAERATDGRGKGHGWRWWERLRRPCAPHSRLRPDISGFPARYRHKGRDAVPGAAGDSVSDTSEFSQSGA
jgi:hypothetical protein